MRAYAGRILHVNLSSEQSRIEILDEKTTRLYLGGIGLGINLLMEHSKPNKDAFDSDNPLIYCTGPLSGTLGLAGSGYAIVSKSPATGCIGEGQIQSFFGSELKRAGYDAIIIKGKATNLSYLWIDDDKIQIRNAQHLKNNSVEAVEQSLRSELGDFSIQVSGIGEAGEKLCRFATIISEKYHTVGRAGLGAVMGSKNLKAIAIRGTQDVNIANIDALTQFIKTVYERAKNLKTTNKGQPLELNNLLELNALSAIATKNWNNTPSLTVSKIFNNYLSNRYVKRTVGCATCCMNCNSIAELSDGISKGVITTFDFNDILSLGPLCGIDRFDAIVKAVNLVNNYGMDCISVGATIAFAMDLYEQGILTNEQTGNVDLRFGNADAQIALIDKIGKRNDWLGNILAEGVMRAAETMGGDASKYACHVKGLELPGYDLRTLQNTALGFSVTFSGDRHLRNNNVGLLDLKDKANRYKIENDTGRKLVEFNHFYNVLDSLIICKLTSKMYTWKDLSDYYLFATGLQISEEELRQIGERIENLARLFNILEGKGTRDYDDLPYKIKTCLTTVEDHKISVFVSDNDLQLGLDDYYAASGWTADGIPTVDRLKHVGLGSLSYISQSAITALRTQQEKEEN
ncbi:MAG: hypothetical protein FWB84_03030 [Candidatus Bathyarchaeota archaeon]|uniref:aldehyde ferredoxin oxidoreductase family protein n=1 Tax=Candidatus Bathycorpusculum sp. TaxID=2994959 RepID=UPI002822348F|nr:hypothetical protein [Candidatus Termiticorpusculum sp.]MCL2257546.1 hypothetical protein [Candidatus Termiticorpusculum sp.]MCL2292320.1 hypothetical protein [Candidatus Termiticorpusculum sp.]